MYYLSLLLCNRWTRCTWQPRRPSTPCTSMTLRNSSPILAHQCRSSCWLTLCAWWWAHLRRKLPPSGCSTLPGFPCQDCTCPGTRFCHCLKKKNMYKYFYLFCNPVVVAGFYFGVVKCLGFQPQCLNQWTVLLSPTRNGLAGSSAPFCWLLLWVESVVS